MTIYTNTELGVSYTLKLNFENIELIHRLFNSDYFRRYIRGITTSSYGDGNLDYDNDNDNSKFDSTILDELIGLKDIEEFKLKAEDIAEIKDTTDYDGNEYYCVRKTKKYRNQEEEDEDDNDDWYKKFDLNTNNVIFHFFYSFIELSSQFSKQDYETTYSKVCSQKKLLKNIQKGIECFKEFGIDEDEITISQYDTYEN